ncbi:MAG: DNA polymerase IV [Candidatus Omnitrophica bacterium]|nr:DNA polymerase IV [Candidatus Omnitrophota bacterium]
MSERTIFHIDMNAFFASVEQMRNPALRGKPVIVCGNPQSRTVVAACSYEAKAYGITNGMAVHEAKQRCPQAVLVGGDPVTYRDIAHHLFAIYEEFTPEVEVFSIDEAFLDMTGTAGVEETARAIKARIRQRYATLTCSVGIGPNKLIAKLASDLQKPDGLVRVRAGAIAALFERLPVESLCGVGPRLQARLNEMGIITCADLGRAPETILLKQFGIIGLALQRMGQGFDESPVLRFHAEDEVKSMGHSYTLPRDTGDREAVGRVLLRLSEQVARRLRAEAYRGRTVHVVVRYQGFATFSRQRSLPDHLDDGLAIYRTARRLLDTFDPFDSPVRARSGLRPARLAKPREAGGAPLPTRAIRMVGVGVSTLMQYQRQLSFLEDEERAVLLNHWLDRINDRFGDFTATRAACLAPLIPKTHGFLGHQRGG